MRFLGLLFITMCVSGPVMAQQQPYTPPPMFGGPVVAAEVAAPVVAAPVVTPQPAPQPVYQQPVYQPPAKTVTTTTPTVNDTRLDLSKREQVRTEKELGGLNEMPELTATTTPLPILQTPNSENQKQSALREQRETEAEQKRIVAAELQMKKDMEAAEREAKKLYGGNIPSVSAEALLDFPVTAQTSGPELQNDPILKSSAAIGQLPKPKAGETIDDTGLPVTKTKQPIVDKILDIEKAKPTSLPKKPKIKEENLVKEIVTIDRDGGSTVEMIEPEKPKFENKPKGITSQTAKMPVIKTKAVEDIPLNPSTAPTAQKTILNFTGSATNLTPAQKINLDKNIIVTLKSNPKSRAQILSYATPTNATGSLSARRVSLARGLDIRTYIMSHAIAPDRIEVRALGDAVNNGTQNKKPTNSANIVIME